MVVEHVSHSISCLAGVTAASEAAFSLLPARAPPPPHLSSLLQPLAMLFFSRQLSTLSGSDTSTERTQLRSVADNGATGRREAASSNERAAIMRCRELSAACVQARAALCVCSADTHDPPFQALT